MTGQDPVAAALARIGRQHSKTIDLSLDRIAARLKALNQPERRLPPVFHVAGTNGKGSTIAFLRAFLEAAGYRCHIFTSPHLIRVNESIRLAGRLIPDDQLLALLDEVEAAGGEPVTGFEALTAAAFLAFSRARADASLVEVGLGGRTDATNLIPQPLVTAVTRISYDHQRFLGDSLAAIAEEKAGIFKPGRPAVVADQPDAAVRERLIAAAHAVGAPLLLHDRDWRVTPEEDGFRYQGPGWVFDLPLPGLVGRHQIMNAGTALAMIEAAGRFEVDRDSVRSGLSQVAWPGRLQRLGGGRLADLLPDGCELWVDGAHNDSGGEALGRQAALWRTTGATLDLIFGVRADKDPSAILAPLAPNVARLRAVEIPGDSSSLPSTETARHARALGIADVETAESITGAIESLVDSRVPQRILICGSLYLAGAVLRENGSTVE